MASVLDIDTPQGAARAHLHAADDARGALVLGHGAGGGVQAGDLVAATEAATAAGFSVALVEQPYRVAGRKAPPRAPQADAAFSTVVDTLRAGPLADLEVVTGGRSFGARVACRTAPQARAAGVLCLAFPLLAPGRRGAPPTSRADELEAVEVPVLVVQGRSDRFGMPEPGKGREVVEVDGDHSLRKENATIAEQTVAWLQRIL